MTYSLPPGPTTPRRITVEMVTAAKERHPEYAPMRRDWITSGGVVAPDRACPASLVAIDEGCDPRDIQVRSGYAIVGVLGLDVSYLGGFVVGVDGKDIAGRSRGGGAFQLGHSDGLAVAAALWPDEPGQDRRETAP